MKFRKVKLLGIALTASVAAFVLFVVWARRNVHQHCMVCAGLGLRRYASDHEGRFPFHSNGFGDALLSYVKEYPPDLPFIVGPDDNGAAFSAALKDNSHVPEQTCSRVYIQGLSETNNPEIAILFDRYATRGGDHFRSRFKDYVREVALVDGSMHIVKLENWPNFVSKQVELLIAAGIPRHKAEAYYADTLRSEMRR